MRLTSASLSSSMVCLKARTAVELVKPPDADRNRVTAIDRGTTRVVPEAAEAQALLSAILELSDTRRSVPRTGGAGGYSGLYEHTGQHSSIRKSVNHAPVLVRRMYHHPNRLPQFGHLTLAASQTNARALVTANTKPSKG